MTGTFRRNGVPMLLEELISQNLKKYILDVSSPNTALFETLIKETAELTSAQHMLCGPIEGQLLSLLVTLLQAKNCLELGTFTGFSALHIAQALPADGKLITCEVRKQHAEIAQRFFDNHPDGHKIDIRLGEALETISTFSQPFDFIFIDADKANYPLYYDHLIPLLRTGGIMVVDNALWGGEVATPISKEAISIDKLNQKARADERVKTIMLTVRDGILLIYKL